MHQFNRFALTGVLAIASVSLTAYAAESKGKDKRAFAGDLAKGITKHSDWLKRFEETRNPRIFAMLASRVGRSLDREQAESMCKLFEESPEKMKEIMQEWGITRDPVAYNEECVNAWKENYGKDALIIKTTHYYILGTQVDEIICNFLKYYQEKIYKYYEKMYPTEEKMEGRFLIYIYPDRTQYLQTGAPGFSGAYYSAADRKLVGYVDAEYRTQRKWIADTRVTTFFHEGFHQYFGYFVPTPPIWLNEGGAMMSEAILVCNKDLKEMGHMDEERCKRIKDAISQKVFTPLATFFKMDAGGFYSNPDLHYPQGWAVSHFLAYGPKEYRAIPTTVVRNLVNGMSRDEAMEDALKDIDVDKMQEDWIEYVKKLKPEKRSHQFYYPR